MAGGRPSLWSEELETQAWDYVNDGWKEQDGHTIPSVVGLCKILGVNRDTLYEWAKHDNKQFSDILKVCNQNQEFTLLNGGLNNKFNAGITKLVLGKHGYHESSKIDHQSSDNSMTPTTITRRVVDGTDNTDA